MVIVCTQPFEPFPDARVTAVHSCIKRLGIKRAEVIHFSEAIEQNPKVKGFWEMWKKMMVDFGIKKGDFIVASEKYGQKLAEILDCEFYPYDIERSLEPVKATEVRTNPLKYFDKIIPDFQKNLKLTVTVFGAESTGKTTLSKALTKQFSGYWVFEYARPYLENTKNEITVQSMSAIWRGQKALQQQADEFINKPVVVQDTDLFSTVGYWQFPHWQKTIGFCPEKLISDATNLKSDLYIVTRSNIPFEADPLRYGGDIREGSDQYWINICKKYKLNYRILECDSLEKRIEEAENIIKEEHRKKLSKIAYDRKGL